MKKIFLSRLLISFFVLGFATLMFLGVTKMQVPKIMPKSDITFISLIPSMTEIIYALGLENNLIAVSDACNWPPSVKNKERIGSMYNINNEKIIELAPTYLLALLSAKPFVQNLENTEKSGIKVLYFEFNNVNDISSAITKIGQIADKNKEAKVLIKKINSEIKGKCKNNPKKILYLIQTQPLITIGSRSYITDTIRLSGNKSITSDVNSYYPAVSQEYVADLEPDVVVVDMFGNKGDVKTARKMFKNVKFIELKPEQKDIINRPGPRVGQSVKFFESLCK